MVRLARGIVHCHSKLSYDSKVSLRELRDQLRSDGFDFVALTEHTLGVSPEAYSDFVAECNSLSSDNFAILPGLEFRCEDGIEIAGFGLWEFTEGSRVAEVVRKIRNQKGYAVWVHPKKRADRFERLLDCDAVEILNGKVDGTIAPDFDLLHWALADQCSKPHVIFGLDLHTLQQPRGVWLECSVTDLEPRTVLEAVRSGRYWNRVARGRISSAGIMSLSTRIQLKTLGKLYRSWDGMLNNAPSPIRKILSGTAKPLIQLIKGQATPKPIQNSARREQPRFPKSDR